MIYPVLVNYIEPFEGDLGTMVIDLHHDFIISIVRQADGSAGIHSKMGFITLVTPFKDFLELYEHYNSGIDRRYEDTIEDYYKDNYINIIKRRKEDGSE